MPLYEYRCEACGEKEERLESFSAPEEHDCPECEVAGAMKRQMSVAAFNLSGGGWYKQGYAGPSGPEAKTETKAEVKVSDTTSVPSSGGCCGSSCACPAKTT